MIDNLAAASRKLVHVSFVVATWGHLLSGRRASSVRGVLGLSWQATSRCVSRVLPRLHT
jgi:hypothetical protein